MELTLRPGCHEIIEKQDPVHEWRVARLARQVPERAHVKELLRRPGSKQGVAVALRLARQAHRTVNP